MMTQDKETLREAVAQLVYEDPNFGAHIPCKTPWVPKGNLIMQGYARIRADVIIATMFERLRTPTEGMIEAANVADRGMLPWKYQWQAMLTAFQQENSDAAN